jgi:hypothetical protein
MGYFFATSIFFDLTIMPIPQSFFFFFGRLRSHGTYKGNAGEEESNPCMSPCPVG